MRDESFSQIRTVKHFSCEEKQVARFQEKLQEDRALREHLTNLESANDAVGTMMSFMTGTLCWYIGTRSAILGEISLGQVATVVAITTHIRDATTTLMNTYSETKKQTFKLAKSCESSAVPL